MSQTVPNVVHVDEKDQQEIPKGIIVRPVSLDSMLRDAPCAFQINGCLGILVEAIFNM